MNKFLVWTADETGDVGKTIEAFDEEDAAEKWADWSDCSSADYSIVGGEAETVFVQNLETKTIKKFYVSGESCPVYSATEVDIETEEPKWKLKLQKHLTKENDGLEIRSNDVDGV